MDEMKISGKFLTRRISKIATRIIKRKTGFNVGVDLKEFRWITSDEGMTNIYLSIGAELEPGDFDKILKQFGLL